MAIFECLEKTLRVCGATSVVSCGAKSDHIWRIEIDCIICFRLLSKPQSCLFFPVFIHTVKHLTKGLREIIHRRCPVSRCLINKANSLSQYLNRSKWDAAAAVAVCCCGARADCFFPPALSPFVFLVYYRALVNFTDSLVYGPELEDIYSSAFNEISEAVVDTVRSVGHGAALGVEALPYKDGAS